MEYFEMLKYTYLTLKHVHVTNSKKWGYNTHGQLGKGLKRSESEAIFKYRSSGL